MKARDAAFWAGKRTVLFDIDGTLLDAGGAGRAAFAAALEGATGSAEGLETVSFAGNTDARVLAEMEGLRRRAYGAGERALFWRLFAEELQARLAAAPAVEVRGARAFVEGLKARGVRCGLLTGNFREGARLKVESAGLGGLFEFGGYGDVHCVRADIAREALEAARAAGADVSAGAACVAGDTPLDVAGGLAAGLPVWGLAGGRYGVEELVAAGAAGGWRDWEEGMEQLGPRGAGRENGERT